MENAKLKSSKVYAWVLVIALGLMSAGTTGSYSVIAGSFVAPVCEEFGFDYSIFSYYFTATLIGLAAALPFVGKLIPKVVGKFWLPVVELILLAAGVGMAFYTEVWMFIAAGALIGVCFAFTTGVAMSDVIDQWFKKSDGLAIGLAWAVNSIYMLIMSPVITSVIEAAGWRTGYLVLAGVSAVLILPASILIIRYKPQDKGMLPYGYVEGETVAETEETTEDSARGVSYARAIKSPAFFFCIGFLCLVQLTCCMNQLFPTYAAEVGFSPMVGGFMVSAASLFDLFLNPIVGTTCDKFGSTKAILSWLAVSILSFVMLMMSSGNSTLSILAAGVNDVMYVIAGTALTVLVMDVFGSRDFGRIFALICSVGYIVGAFGMPVMMKVYELVGSFQGVFIFCIACNVIIGLFLLLAKKTGKSLSWDE